MKKSFLFLLLLCGAVSTKVFSQTGQICFIRNTGTKGSIVNISVYIDDSLTCKLKNKSYSMHDIPVGDHFVSALSGGIGSKKRIPFKVTVSEGKISYVNVLNMDSNLTCEEVTENTGSQRIKTLIENTNCHGTK